MAYGTVNADVMQTSTTNGVLGAKNASTLQNRLINAGFTINQRVYVTNTALASGVYAHDRFKAGAGGCTYTFTQGSAGVPIVITITAGSLQQVIEGCNMPEGGTYVLSWTGTAQARFNGGTYGSSPLAVTGITAGANTTIEFNTGTVSYPQLEVGSSATGFEYRQYQQELALCQRYYLKYTAPASNFFGFNCGSVSGVTAGYFGYNNFLRATPTVTFSNLYMNDTTVNALVTSVNVPSSPNSTLLQFTASGGGLTAARATVLYNASASNGYFDLSAEL
jgi:hypothetical protein